MRLFYRFSLVAILASAGIGAEEAISQEEPKKEESAPSMRPSVVLSPSSAVGKDPTLQQKQRAHFAGAKRPPLGGRVKKNSKPKKSKNPWFSSKTHPKAERRDELEEETTSLPENAPHFIKRTSSSQE